MFAIFNVDIYKETIRSINVNRGKLEKRLTVGGDKFIADALRSCGPILECLRTFKNKTLFS